MNKLLKENLKNEYFVTDMNEHLFLRGHGFDYSFVKVIEGTTIYKYPVSKELLDCARKYYQLNGAFSEAWIVDMNLNKHLKDKGLRYNFVKRVCVGKDDSGKKVLMTVYKYSKSDELFIYMRSYQKILKRKQNN